MSQIQNEELEQFLCRCERQQGATNSGLDIAVALEGGRHTKFLVWKCKTCSGIIGFPSDNLKIFLEEGTLESKVWFFNKIIKAEGYKNQAKKATEKPWWKFWERKS
jgi:hypothetical protein